MAVTTANTRAVECASPHDNEVIGAIRYEGQDAFPGAAALQSYAETACIRAFGTYVGIDFQTSSLNMMPVLPTDLTWAKGDRQVVCVVLAADGSKLTGSVEGTAR